MFDARGRMQSWKTKYNMYNVYIYLHTGWFSVGKIWHFSNIPIYNFYLAYNFQNC